MTERTLRISARMAEEIQQWASDELSQWPRDTAYAADLESLLSQLTAAQPAPDAVAEATAGPRPAFLTCKGCPAFSEEWWREPSGDGETYDSGTSQDCKAAGRSIATYGSANPWTPEWCPALAKGPSA